MQILVKYSKLETQSSSVPVKVSLMNAFKGVPLAYVCEYTVVLSSLGQHHCIDHQVEK